MTERDPFYDLSAPEAETGPSFSTVLKDLLAFELKLLVDGLKDVVFAQGAVLATVIDLFLRRKGMLHRLMRAGERFDEWLGLFRPMSGGTVEPPPEEEALLADANRVLRAADRKMRDRRSRGDDA